MMKKVSVRKLSKNMFDLYGNYADMTAPAGPHLGEPPCEFYRDMVLLTMGHSTVGFSVTQTYKRELIIKDIEHHNCTGEAIMPIDGDVYIHVAPASAKDIAPFDEIEVFYVPKGTLVTFRPGVWHSGPYCVEADVVNVLVVLPERTYVNDCNIVSLPEEEQLEISV